MPNVRFSGRLAKEYYAFESTRIESNAMRLEDAAVAAGNNDSKVFRKRGSANRIP